MWSTTWARTGVTIGAWVVGTTGGAVGIRRRNARKRPEEVIGIFAVILRAGRNEPKLVSNIRKKDDYYQHCKSPKSKRLF
jgi:hypothetical protein